MQEARVEVLSKIKNVVLQHPIVFA